MSGRLTSLVPYDRSKMKISELLRLACIYAEQDRIEFIDAMSNCTTQEDIELINKEKQYLKDLVKYRDGRWPKNKVGRSGDDVG